MKNNKSFIIITIVLLTQLVLMTGIFLNSKNTLDAGTFNNMSVSTSGASAALYEEKVVPLVVIDAGHGGWEPGADNGSFFEKNIVLAISLEIEKELIKKNINYYIIRKDDTYFSLKDRTNIANDKKASLFVSIHNNSFSDPAQGGILTAYNPYSSNGKDIAKIMQSKISDLGMKNRDVMARPNLYVLRHTEMPSLLLEIGFISNKNDLNLMTDTGFQQKCAQQIVLGIDEILQKYIVTNGITAGEENSSAK